MAAGLKEAGFEVALALNGEDGLRMAKEYLPDLILLDLILPKIDGFEVLEKLKEKEITKDIPVIVLTNLENPADIEKAIRLGAKGYLVKANYSLEEVINKIKQAIS
jgi:CheY-like chemotaxis protein